MKKQRLIGIDLCRGFAAYAVVLLHSGDKTWGSVSDSAKELSSFFIFAVPFFLATSFYFTVGKSSIKLSSDFWKSRFQRIIVPYITWTLVYLAIKIPIFYLFQQSNKLDKLLDDPMGIIFLGGASVQLYFLPILIAGTFAITFLEYFNKTIKLNKLALLSVLSIGLNQLLVLSGNSYSLADKIAFKSLLDLIAANANDNPVLRLLLVNISWIIRCLPYIFTGMLLKQLIPYLQSTKWNKMLHNIIPTLSLTMFLIFAIWGRLLIPSSLNSFIIAYLLLLFGIYYLGHQNNPIAKNLGLCSYGIYLIHTFFVQVFKLVIAKINPSWITQVSVVSLLLYSVSIFLISWLTVLLMMKNKTIAKYMFGA
ncbi:MAG: acyltransferase [Cyanobacteria bacterium J06633_8]